MTAPLPDILEVRPFTHPARGEAVPPGSKSLTNRALLLAALCDHPVTLTGALFSDDTRIMAEALRRLGFAVSEDAAERTIRVEGRGGAIPSDRAEIFVGLAGTAARFLTALCAAAPRGIYRLDGVPQMRRRPMRGLIEALRTLGAPIRCLGEEGFLPLEIGAQDPAARGGLEGGQVGIDASESSQMLSAVLMVAPLARSGIRISRTRPVREPFVRMTAELMGQFGVKIAAGPDGLMEVSPGAYHLGIPAHTAESREPGRTYPVEPDATAASYFLALPLVAGGQIRLPGFGGSSLQGDVKFAPILQRAGLALEAGPSGLVARFAGGQRFGVTQDFAEFSDTFLTLAAIAPLLEGPTTITGIAHTRKQETDRVHGAAVELERLGQEVRESEDSLTIIPRPLTPGRTIDTYGDHRFAMSFAILGCHDLRGDGSPWLSIRDPACCAKTFPDFFGLLESLRAKSSPS